jgi:hypothetical protein
MLAYQTFAAATDSELPFSCLLQGGLDARQVFQDAEFRSRALIVALAQGGNDNSELVAENLLSNRDLRRLFDLFARKTRGKFDNVYRPVGGWNMYFQRCSSEMHCIEEFEEIQKTIAQD